MAWFDFLNAKTDNSHNEIKALFPLMLKCDLFIINDIVSTYTKILTDTVDRTFGIPKEAEKYLWDNIIEGDDGEGLITMLAKAMANRADLYIVYKPSIGVIRYATRDEQDKIKKDYEKNGKSSVGVYVSFKKYRRTEMLRIWSEFEYCLLAGMNKQLHLSQSVQLKVNELRASVSLQDSEVAIKQAKAIAEAIRNGNEVLIDKNDEITMMNVNMDASKSSMEFLATKKAWILSMPASYLSGEQTEGIGSSGENDSRAVENGLKQYFVSILKPICDLLFDADCKFKSRDFRNMTTALEVLKTFDLVSDDNLSRESKQEIVALVFDLDLKDEQKQLKKEAKSLRVVENETQNEDA